MSNSTPVRAENALPTGSRVNWSSVFAGVAIALSLYFLMTLTGAAIGLSVGDRVGPTAVGWGAAGWAIFSTIVALFVGGWVSSQLTVGESKTEAAMQGIILWAVMFSVLLWLMAAGVRSGFNAMVGMAQASGQVTQGTTNEDWEAVARRAGVSQGAIDEFRRKTGDNLGAAMRKVEDPENQKAAAAAITWVTWLAVLGTILSMAAAVGGAIVGSGPTLRLSDLGGRPRHPAFDRHEHANV